MFPRRALALPLLFLLSSCDTREMVLQPKKGPLDGSPLFADGRASRMPVPDTVARGQLFLDAHLYQGKVNGKPAETFPVPVTETLIRRGQDRFNIYCSVCHGRTGIGNGMIVQRGFKKPESFHSDRLRKAPPGYFFDVMTNGFGVMYSYADRIPAEDRWAIIAYIRTLQRSQNARLSDVPDEERSALEAQP